MEFLNGLIVGLMVVGAGYVVAMAVLKAVAGLRAPCVLQAAVDATESVVPFTEDGWTELDVPPVTETFESVSDDVWGDAIPDVKSSVARRAAKAMAATSVAVVPVEALEFSAADFNDVELVYLAKSGKYPGASKWAKSRRLSPKVRQEVIIFLGL